MDANLDAQLQAEREARAARGVSLAGAVSMDLELYGGSGAEFSTEVEEEPSSGAAGRRAALPQRVIAQHNLEAEADGDAAMKRFRGENSSVSTARIADREDEYRKNRQRLALSPDRGGDVFAGAAPARSYAEILAAQQLAREKDELTRKLARQQQQAALLARAEAQVGAQGGSAASAASAPAPQQQPGRRRRMWDDAGDSSAASAAPPLLGEAARHAASALPLPPPPPPPPGFWGATPLLTGPAASGAGDATPLLTAHGGGPSRWDETPLAAHGGAGAGAGASSISSSSSSAAAAAAGGAWGGAARPKRSRWEETPLVSSAALAAAAAAAALGATPLLPASGSGGSETPHWAGASASASASAAPAPPLLTSVQARIEYEMSLRNAPQSDEDLDAMLPQSGYRILPAPASYVPLRDASKKLLATPTPQRTPGFSMAPTPHRDSYGVPLEAPPGEGGYEGASPAGIGGLPYVKPEDAEYFQALIGDAGARAEEELTAEESRARLVAVLLLKIKNGTPPQRKVAMRTITEKARELGPGPLFSAVLPLLMSHTLEDHERHLLVKVIERCLVQLDELVRPYAHKILVVVEPMLIDDDYYARVEGRELVANLAKAAGLATMITVMRPDIDSPNEYARNTTARALAVTAGTLGVATVLPFLKAVTASKKSWQARHTGCKVVQQTALLVGCGVLPHLTGLVETVAPCTEDSEQKVCIMAILAIAALAEAAAPYGIEAFVGVLRPLVKGCQAGRGKALAACLKAVGNLLPLMDAAPAAFFTKEVMPSILREFASNDEDMRKIVLRCVCQIAGSEGCAPEYLRAALLPEFFAHFWTRRAALDRRTARAVCDTTLALSLRTGAVDALTRIAPLLKDAAETLRRMALESVQRCVGALGLGGCPPRLEEELVDGLLYAFQEQGIAVGVEGEEGDAGAAAAASSGSGPSATSNARVILSAFGTVLEALGARAKPYLAGIAGNIKWRLNNKSPHVRMLAADLVQRVAPCMKACGEDALLAHLGLVLYECLGEEYPEVLGSLLGGLRACVSACALSAMQPPIKDLLPRLTPILKNRAEKVQENCIDLVGRIAERGAALVSPKEWMRICMELLELLRAPRKALRRAAVNTFGFIAKAVSPQDVLHVLLNNLKVQERTNRVCTTVAIGIIAEACAPFTVLPALLNEYRTPDMNVQNGVLKSLSFMFEYIGETARDYVYACVPLLADALIDRDAVHRQTAAAVIKHLALGLQGAGCEDALLHLLNFLWPNIFETSPHVIGAVLEAVEALRCSLGPGVILAYVRAGLFHPARRVREVYWRLYNNLVVYSGHALVAYLPGIPEEGSEGEGGAAGGSAAGAGGAGGGAKYRRTMLELCL